MAPKKRVSSSTKKANQSRQQPQASKYGIQHFFERHSQTQTASTSFSSIEPPKHSPNSEATANSSSVIEQVLAQSTPCPAYVPQSAAIVNDDEISSKISPDFTRNASLKRLKYSPSLMIRPSQDDISDDVTWKVSPVNEKLRKLTAKQLPRTMRIFSDRPRPIASCIHPCLQVQNSICSAGSLEKWLSSPTAHASGKSVSCSRMLSAEQETEACHCNDNAGTNSSKAFQTPPSASYDPSQLTAAIVCNRLSDEMELGQLHRKAFLELLDQVEDVIIDKAPNSGRPVNTGVANCQTEKICDPTKSRSDVCALERVEGSLNDEIFLVLEVTEKHKSDDPTRVKTPYKVLRLLNELTGEEKVLNLFDEWFYSIIGPGDTVNAIGEFDQEGKCIVDHSKNFVIVFPEILVSGTKVASSFHCPRRAVLDERLKASEQSVPALIGTLLHQIFQAGLLKKFPTRQYLEEFAAKILQKNLQNLYASNADQNETFAQLLDAIPRILNWIKCFRDVEERRGSVVDFGNNGGKEVSITEVMDIEEMAWAPKYGLKGIIDASLRIRMASDFGDSQEKIVPLEFKSGKATSQTTTEHRAQVILYTLLMSERYLDKEIDAGLLYYLFADETRGVKVQRSDLVGLIMRRNELASDILKASTSRLLPPMLKNPMVCKSCRHLNSCTIYHKAYGGDHDASGLGDLFDRNVGHLNTADIEFLKHWDHLIDLEAKTCRVASKEMRACHLGESSSSCLSPLVLDVTNGYPADGSLKNDRYVYHFIHQNGARCNHETNNVDIRQPSELQVGSFISSLKCGDFVIISTESGRPAIANGMICSISQCGVSVSLSKMLRLPGSYCTLETSDLTREVWRIDKDEITSAYATMRFNLVKLFFPTLQNPRLRKIIVDLEAPRFDSGVLVSQDPAVSYVRLEKSINDDQRRAIQKILSAKDYSLILGMPGTGKTSTMVHAVKALLMRGQSILLTSYTNSAVDNLLIKLKTQGIDFVRIGRLEAVHNDVHQHCFSATDAPSLADIRQRMEQVRVVGVTCLGIYHPLLVNKKFDVCIMDEAGQITLPVSLGPLMLASIFVLVGDHYQLPPLVQSPEAREKGMKVSLFCRLSEAHPQAIATLQCQYRMCSGIMELSNLLIYGNRLRCASPEIADAKINLSLAEPITSWIKEVLDPNKSVIFINTDNLPACEIRENDGIHNPSECSIILEITRQLLEREVPGDEIGVITPYNSQACLIQRVVNSSIEIHTIDKYQGRDKDCLIVSFVRASENAKACNSSILGDWHRINVALTRAKKKLIMVGSCGTLSKVPLLKLLIEKVNEQGGLLHISKKDFGAA